MMDKLFEHVFCVLLILSVSYDAHEIGKCLFIPSKILEMFAQILVIN